MPGWERDSWRWAVAVAAICAVLLSVGLALGAEGLGAAANLVQVLSVVSLVGGLAAWGRNRRGSPGRMVSRQIRLAGLLRDIAEAHARSDTEIREALVGWDVDAFLDGARQPGWDFVTAFLSVIADGDQVIREGLEHLVRPSWEASQDQARGGSVGGGASVLVQVTTETGVWLTVTQQAAEASRTAECLQESAAELQSWREALVFTLGKYASAVSTLAAERDEMAAQLAAQDRAQRQESSHAAQAALIASELRDVQARLVLAEQRQEQVSQRLAATERKLRVAEDLRDNLLAHVARSRRQLVGFEHRPVPISPSIALPATNAPYRLMGDADQRLGEEILRHADSFLRQQDAALSQHAATLARLRTAMPGYPHRQAVMALAVALAVTAGLGVLTLSGDQPSTMHSPYWTATLSGPKNSNLMSVAFSPDGTTLAVGDYDGSTYLWNLATRKITATLTYPGDMTVTSVAFSRDGTTLAVGDWDSNIYLWNLATRKITAILSDPSVDGLIG